MNINLGRKDTLFCFCTCLLQLWYQPHIHMRGDRLVFLYKKWTWWARRVAWISHSFSASHIASFEKMFKAGIVYASNFSMWKRLYSETLSDDTLSSHILTYTPLRKNKIIWIFFWSWCYFCRLSFGVADESKSARQILFHL